MPKKPRKRIYWRNGRAWADLRDYADVIRRVEGSERAQEPLVAPGERWATRDEQTAQKLLSDRLDQLERYGRNEVFTGRARVTSLGEFVPYFAKKRGKSPNITERWVEELQQRVEVAQKFFETHFKADANEIALEAIRVKDVRAYMEWLSHQNNGRGGTYSNKTQRDYLQALGNLYELAQKEERVTPGYNPVTALGDDRPRSHTQEAKWIEIHEATLFLEAARLYRPHGSTERNVPAIQFPYPLIATFLLTGARESEVLGLAVDDVSFDRKTITFRPHPWRRLKTHTSKRVLPLWPQLEEILREYVFGSEGPPNMLLFPSPVKSGTKESTITDIRKMLDGVGRVAGFDNGAIRSKMFRHTYCAARLQTLDGGHPVSPFTVAREMGHGGTRLVERIYGHLGNVRHRSEFVEYQVSDHGRSIQDELRMMEVRVRQLDKKVGASGT